PRVPHSSPPRPAARLPSPVPTAAPSWPPAAITSALALPAALPILNVTALRPGTAAVNVFGPTVGPNVQLPSVASPLASVDWLAPVTLPPPDAAANVTATFGTGLLHRKSTRPNSSDARTSYTAACWMLPALITTALTLP